MEENDSESDHRFPYVEEGGWIHWFCKLEGNEFFVEIDEDFIRNKVNLIGTIIIILMGIYSILIENAALVLIGLLLICYVILDIVNYFNNKKRVH